MALVRLPPAKRAPLVGVHAAVKLQILVAAARQHEVAVVQRCGACSPARGFAEGWARALNQLQKQTYVAVRARARSLATEARCVLGAGLSRAVLRHDRGHHASRRHGAHLELVPASARPTPVRSRICGRSPGPPCVDLAGRTANALGGLLLARGRRGGGPERARSSRRVARAAPSQATLSVRGRARRALDPSPRRRSVFERRRPRRRADGAAASLRSRPCARASGGRASPV